MNQPNNNYSSPSPPLPNLHSLSISPSLPQSQYPPSNNIHRYNGVFGPPSQQTPTSLQDWSNPQKRNSRNGLPSNWYDPNVNPSPVLRESPNPHLHSHFDAFRRDPSSPPTLSPPSSTTSAPTTSSSHPYHPYPQPSYPPLEQSSFSAMSVTPSPPPMPYSLTSAASAPNISGFNGGALPQYGSQSLANLSQHGRPQQNGWRTGYNMPNIPTGLDDDVIPTAIVIKNIPFAVTRETLLGVMESLGAPLPYAFNYHHDSGVFRGLAFANFRAPEEAASVVAALNGYDVQGRKLRVEYKKVLQPGEKDKIEREKALKRMRSIQFDKTDLMPPPISTMPLSRNINSTPNGVAYSTQSDLSPPHSATSTNSDTLPATLDMNDPMALDIYSRILVFKEDRMRDEVAFSKNLTPTERRIVHLVAQKLGLSSITRGEGDAKSVVVLREAPPRPVLTSSSSATISSTYLSPYSSTPSDLSPNLRIKKSMPDLRGFNGPVVARDPARSLTPQRSSGNLRGDIGGRDYVSMGHVQGRRANGHSNGPGSGTFNNLFGAPIGDIPPVPPLPSGLHAKTPSITANGSSPDGSIGDSFFPSSQSQPLRNPRGPAGESRGFGGTLRPSASARGTLGLGRRVSEEDEEEVSSVGGHSASGLSNGGSAIGGGASAVETYRTRESLDI